jgi:hypothetical protein
MDSITGSHAPGVDLLHEISGSLDLSSICRKGYPSDTVLHHIINAPFQRDNFRVRDGVIHTFNYFRCWVICVPSWVMHGNRCVIELLLEQAHSILGHLR